MLDVKGSVNLIGKVIVGVKLSYVPTCFTSEGCINCNQILSVKIIDSQVNLRVTVLAVPNNVGQFYLEFDTDQAITNFIFTYSVQINPDLGPKYTNCFSTQDYAQLVVRTVETAYLATFDTASNQNLSLDQLNPDPIQALNLPQGALAVLA